MFPFPVEAGAGTTTVASLLALMMMTVAGVLMH